MTKMGERSVQLALSGQRAPVDYDRAPGDHGMLAEKDVLVPTRDGVKIAVDVYRPETTERVHICSSKTVLHRIFHDPKHPSHLLLPVIPSS
jgi:predicted acyl esterase